ncbi:glycosyltransferase family 39 protein [Balneola sp. MJW-20]|uniref:glycosyltransferase family 39 protein n=1 Tax=Gracilimonas aurantiaca TaxID=3234185 RepID=UPI003464F903
MESLRSKITLSVEWQLILFFAITKLSIHLLTYDNYELHRDAYLYYAQSQHLAWGFVAVPPSIAFIGYIATSIFGNTVFALRFFPALIGAFSTILIGMTVLELGGKKKAVLLACAAYVISPAYLHVNTLFQPVSFNHFYWILSGYLILRMIHRKDPKMWIWIGLVFGLAFLNKYSIAFFILAFGMALLISEHRKLLFNQYFVVGLGIGLLIITPNLIWQYEQNWPVVSHMTQLRETQLIHVQASDFLLEQLLMNMQALLIWFTALLILLFNKKEKQYRIFGYLFIGVIVLLLAGSGKSYYTLGVYPILFAFGAYLIEKYTATKKYSNYVTGFLILFMVPVLYISLDLSGIPFRTPEQMSREAAFRWEDGRYYDIPQDMSDMRGWKEIGEEVKKLYLSLPGEERNEVAILANHYGQAGSVMFYGKQAGVPQPITFNDSFVLWAPDSLNTEYVIYIMGPWAEDIEERLQERYEIVTLIKTIENPWFRENGTRIFLCRYPNDSMKSLYTEGIRRLKDQYKRAGN